MGLSGKPGLYFYSKDMERDGQRDMTPITAPLEHGDWVLVPDSSEQGYGGFVLRNPLASGRIRRYGLESVTGGADFLFSLKVLRDLRVHHTTDSEPSHLGIERSGVSTGDLGRWRGQLRSI